MPSVKASDGASLHWEGRGAGPTILLVPYWSMHPSVFDNLEAILEPDHHVVRFDERGSGKSARSGPYDLATGISDLEAVCEELGRVDVALCLVDASNRAVRIADSRPDLLRTVVCMGSAPFGVGPLRGSDSLISSEAVIGAFLQQLEADPRGAIRAALAGANTGLSEDELRDRVHSQLEYIDSEAATERARAWASDGSAVEPAQRIGDRLYVCLSPAMGGADSWFPAATEMEPIVRDLFPEARVLWTSDGIISSPGEAAAVIRSAASIEAVPAYDRPE